MTQKAFLQIIDKQSINWEVVVTLFVERLLSMSEVRGLTPVIGKIYIEHLFVFLFIINCIEQMKLNKKRLGMAHFLKKVYKLKSESFLKIASRR